MKTILVMEDETNVCQNSLELLETEGVEGISAENGKVGVFFENARV